MENTKQIKYTALIQVADTATPEDIKRCMDFRACLDFELISSQATEIKEG